MDFATVYLYEGGACYTYHGYLFGMMNDEEIPDFSADAVDSMIREKLDEKATELGIDLSMIKYEIEKQLTIADGQYVIYGTAQVAEKDTAQLLKTLYFLYRLS